MYIKAPKLSGLNTLRETVLFQIIPPTVGIILPGENNSAKIDVDMFFFNYFNIIWYILSMVDLLDIPI